MTKPTDTEILAAMRQYPTLAALVREVEYVLEHTDDPPPKRSHEEIQAAIARANTPRWIRWLRG